MGTKHLKQKYTYRQRATVILTCHDAVQPYSRSCQATIIFTVIVQYCFGEIIRDKAFLRLVERDYVSEYFRIYLGPIRTRDMSYFHSGLPSEKSGMFFCRIGASEISVMEACLDRFLCSDGPSQFPSRWRHH